MQALILAGGSGTRFWPASRRRRPKQLLPLDGDRTLLRRTLDRLLPAVDPGDVWVATGRELGDQVRCQLPEVPPAQILLEPVGRNTAPAIAWALASMPPAKRQEVVASLHSDHWIEDEDAFRSTLVAAAAAAAERDRVIALGVRPRWAETGYGYLETEQPSSSGADGPHQLLRVLRFREKPDAATAEAFVAGGRHLWNAGIFAFRGTTLLDHLRRLEPALVEGVTAAAADPSRLDAIYPELPALPIDTAVMERLDELHTVVLDCGWSDCGSWAALAEALAGTGGRDANAARGDTLALDASDNLLFSEDGLVAVLGVEGLAVVQSGNAVLVVPKARSQEVRRIVDELRRRGREDLL
ncbi:MAG TPA: sugar phosphate nucleotidyltransferase [Thermoanaerobaculia bacterium]|nr:sugar phosphate nucleotidyltransferase [Thermoanaerobaculia bacterium]